MTQPTDFDEQLDDELPTSSTETLAQLVALVAAQAAIRQQLVDTAVRAVLLAFGAITNWYAPEQTARAVRDAVRIVQASQRRMAQVTDAYLARSTSLVTGTTVSPVGSVDIRALRRQLPPDVIEALARAPRSESGQGPALSRATREDIIAAAERETARAVPAEEVYGRLADNYRYLVASKANSEDEARRKTLLRGQIVADTDIALADRAQVQAFFTQRLPRSARGYRRVIHPEVGSGAPPCGLCVVASDNVYRTDELMPIHARCRCTVVAVGSDQDPGRDINREDLRRIYKAAGGAQGRQLKTVRVEVTEHGELGPVLTYAEQRFRGPREYARTQSRDQETRVLAQLERVEDELEKLLDQRSGLDDDSLDDQIDWHRFKQRELNARLPR